MPRSNATPMPAAGRVCGCDRRTSVKRSDAGDAKPGPLGDGDSRANKNARPFGLAFRLFALFLVAALVTSLAKQLAVLLLRHALTALLDDRTHRYLTDLITATGSVQNRGKNASG